MSTSEFVLQLVSNLALPVLILILVLLFRKPIYEFLMRMNRASSKIAGAELSLAIEPAPRYRSDETSPLQLTEPEKKLVEGINWDRSITLIEFVYNLITLRANLHLYGATLFQDEVDAIELFIGILDSQSIKLNLGSVVQSAIKDMRVPELQTGVDTEVVAQILVKNIDFIYQYINNLALRKQEISNTASNSDDKI